MNISTLLTQNFLSEETKVSITGKKGFATINNLNEILNSYGDKEVDYFLWKEGCLSIFVKEE